MTKPVILTDLDDTLFQTRRKMVDELALEPTTLLSASISWLSILSAGVSQQSKMRSMQI